MASSPTRTSSAPAGTSACRTKADTPPLPRRTRRLLPLVSRRRRLLERTHRLLPCQRHPSARRPPASRLPARSQPAPRFALLGGSSLTAGVGGATSPQPSSAAARRPSGSVQVPGGWIGLPFAAALAALGTLVWLRRRRRYVPGLATGLDEPDLPATSAVIAAARRQVQAHAPHLLLPDPDEPTTTEYAQALRDGRTPLPVPPPEPGGPELAGLPTALAKQGIGLTGPGAEDAARALLVATLTAAGPDDPDLGGHVITTHAVLARLLDPRTADRAARLPRLITADTLDGVLARADNDIATRRILLDDADAADLTAYRADPNNEPIPPVVVITETPDTTTPHGLSPPPRAGTHSTSPSSSSVPGPPEPPSASTPTGPRPSRPRTRTTPIPRSRRHAWPSSTRTPPGTCSMFWSKPAPGRSPSMCRGVPCRALRGDGV